MRKQMTTAHTHTHTHLLAHIVAGITPATTCWRWFCSPLRSIPVCLNSSFPILTKQILSHYISKLFKHWRSWSCILYAVVHRSVVRTAVNEGRGYRSPLSLYIPRTRREGTIVAVLHFHFVTPHSADAKVNFLGKSTRFLTFWTTQVRK